MTFSILGFCPEADQVGIGYTAVTLAGGGTSPFYSYAGDIVVVQAYGNQHAAIAGARALDAGLSMPQVCDAMEAVDPHSDYRQVGSIGRSGEPFGLTGSKARPWARHIVGDELCSDGQCLGGEAGGASHGGGVHRTARRHTGRASSRGHVEEKLKPFAPRHPGRSPPPAEAPGSRRWLRPQRAAAARRSGTQQDTARRSAV